MAAHKCAVVIPAKNAVSILPRVLSKVLAQDVPWSYEVIVIDSGSRDGTVDYLRAQDRVRLVEIPPERFGHGRTRNLGIEAADAEFIAFLTHDAEPVKTTWLANLVAAAEQDDRIAGVFGRHIANLNASPFIKYDLDQHFKGFLAHPLIVSRGLDPLRYENDIHWRQLLHYYSDNNSLLRKSVWHKIPYPDVEFAEDQLWARAIIEAGYSKAYAPDAAVYHSHDYTTLEQLRRAFDESRNFKKYFGYELSAHPLKAFVSMMRLTHQAMRQRIDEGYGTVSLIQRLSRASQRAALVGGHCLGANHEKLPRGLVERLSLDQRLFKS